MKKPNFFIIGAPRCGTTALSEYLRGHPNIFVSSVKEPQYFAFDFADRGIPLLDSYLSLFSNVDLRQHIAVGEASTCYLFSKIAVPEILRFNQDARFIVMLRNPVDLLKSLHSHLLFNQIEDQEDFETSWRKMQERKSFKGIPHLCRDSKWLMYSEWGLLGEQVRRLFSVVDRKRIKIIFFEDFTKNSLKVYDETLDFLGVPSDGRKQFPQINANRKIKAKAMYRGLLFLGEVWRRIRPKWFIARFGIYTQFSLMLSNPAEKIPISDEFREELFDFYFHDISNLSRLTGRDLSHWVTNRKSLSTDS